MKQLVMVGVLACAAETAAAEGRIRIVSIGDSLASGEGNPDTARALAITVPMWDGSRDAVDNGWGDPSALAAIDGEDTMCHRSQNAGHKLMSLRLGESLPGDDIEFTSVACSGAKIPELVSVGQSVNGASVLPQLDRVAQLFPPGDPDAAIDVLVISIGINDVGFADAVATCIFHPHCPADGSFQGAGYPDPWPADPSWAGGLVGRPADREPRLRTRWRHLIHAIETKLPNVGMVLVHEYPDGMTDWWGMPCNGMKSTWSQYGRIRVPLYDLLANVTALESMFASVEGIQRLNNAVDGEVTAAAARTPSRWTYHRGMEAAFRGHGFCAGDDAAWIRLWDESIALQGDWGGTAHPNQYGHPVYAAALRDHLLQVDWERARDVISAPVAVAMPRTSIANPHRVLVPWTWSGAPAMFFQVAFRSDDGQPLVPPPALAGVPWQVPGAPSPTADLDGDNVPDPDADGTIWRSIGTDGWQTWTRVGNGATRAWEHTLPWQGWWHVSVRACSYRTCGPWSVPREFHNLPPSAPTGLHQVATPAGPQVRFGWSFTGTIGATRTELAWRPRGGAWSSLSFPAWLTPGSFDVGADTVVFDVYVRACNAVGCSPWSTGVRGTTAAAPTIGPSGIVKVLQSTFPFLPELRWSNPAPPPGGQIHLAVAPQYGTLLPNGLAIIPPYQHYRLSETATRQTVSAEVASWVRACNPRGCSAWAARAGGASFPTPSSTPLAFAPDGPPP